MTLGSTLRLLEPEPGLLAFYDGRVPGRRVHGPQPNWQDDGAYELGIASYALVSKGEALVYDTHMSIPHAARVRQAVEARGAQRITVVLSHWHKDHVAGNAVFSDCEILALAETAALLKANRAAIEAADPPIRPLVMPTRTVDGAARLAVGAVEVELRPLDVHSRDGLVLHLPDRGLLLAGDTLEDTVTFVAEPDRLARHRAELDRLKTWGVTRILPNHGDEARIAGGGYGPDFIDATIRYVDFLERCRKDPALAARPLRDVLSADLASGALTWFAPYEAVHASNLARVAAAARTDAR